MTAIEIRTPTASNFNLHVGPPGPAVAAEAAALLNESLGSGYVRPSTLAELATEGGGVLIRGRGRDGALLGATTARVLDQKSRTALHDRLRLAGVDGGLEGHRIGEVQSIVVTPAARGLGLATSMLTASLDFLKAGGCRCVVSASWVSDNPQHASLGLLERAGFAQLATIPSFWSEDQQASGFLCPMCGPECVCAAIILMRPLGDWRGARGPR